MKKTFTPKHWSRPEGQPLYEKPEHFLALVAGNVLQPRSAGFFEKSASAIRIIPQGGSGEVRTIVEQHVERFSTDARGFVAGVAMIVEALPAGSSVLIMCRQEFISGTLNGWLDRWAAKGFTKKPDEHRDIWRRVYEVRERRGLKVTGSFERKGESKYDEQLDALAEAALREGRRIFDRV